MGTRIGWTVAAALLVVLGAGWVQAADREADLRFVADGQDVRGGARILGTPAEGDAPRAPGPPEGRGPRAYLGVELSPGEGGGAAVGQVLPDSPAAMAGLKNGDIITAIDGKAVDEPGRLVERLGECQPGDRVVFSVKRDGKTTEVPVVLGRAAPEPPRARAPREPRPEGERPGRQGQVALGIMASPLPEEMKPIAGTDKGVLINSITDNSPAAKAGLLAGDVITALDGKEVTDPGQVVDVTRQHKRGDQVKVTYYRMGKRNETAVTLGEVPQARGLRPMELPEELYKNLPQLREYLEKALPDIEEWAKQQQPGLRPPIPGVPMPEWQPPQGRPQAPSYDMGKDMGRIIERLDRIERRLDELEKRLNQSEKR